MKQNVLSSKVLLVIFFLSACSLHSFSQGTLQAVNDTFDLYPGVPRVYDILANDTIPATDTVKSLSWGGDGSVRITWVHDLSWKWTITFCAVKLGNPPEIQYLYVVHTMSHGTSSAKIVFRIHDKSYSYIDINNVRARFNAWGNHFYHENCEYEVPKGSGKNSIFNNAFWIGGKDAQGNLHLAAERYEQGASGNAGTCHDFYIGPVMDSAKYSIYQDTVWQYIWNLKKTDIERYRTVIAQLGIRG